MTATDRQPPAAETMPAPLMRWSARVDDTSLALALGGPATDALSAAIALQASADWLDGIDDWLAPTHGVDWQPADTPPEGPRLWGRVVDANGATVRAIGLPLPLLRRVEPPPAALGLQWPGVEAVLMLAMQAPPPEGMDGLVEGSVLLLEDSFRPQWPIALRLASAGDHADEGVALCCDGAQAWPAPLALPRSADDGGPHLQLTMRLPDTVPLPLLAGWRTSPPGRLRLARSAELQLVDTDEAGRPRIRPLARGELIPWGRGHALRVGQRLPSVSAAGRTATPPGAS